MEREGEDGEGRFGHVVFTRVERSRYPSLLLGQYCASARNTEIKKEQTHTCESNADLLVHSSWNLARMVASVAIRSDAAVRRTYRKRNQ